MLRPDLDWKRLRTALGLSQAQMGRLIGVSHTCLWQLETGRSKRPHEATLLLLELWLQDPLIQEQLRLGGYPPHEIIMPDYAN